MFLLFFAASTPVMFSLAIGESNTSCGPLLPLNALALAACTNSVSLALNSPKPSGPANDSLNPYAANMMSALTKTKC